MNKAFSSKNLFALTFLWAAGVLSLLAYKISGMPFHFDDYLHLWKAAFMPTDVSYADMPQTKWSYRPLLTAFYWVDYQLHGFSPRVMRLTNVFLHLVNLFLVFKIWLKKESKGYTSLLGLVLLFVLFHPVLWHSVLYISARSTVLVTTFILLTLLLFKNKNQMFWLTAFVAPFIKEVGVLALPLCLILNFEESKKNFLVVWNDKKKRTLMLAFTALGGMVFSLYFFRYVVVLADTLFGGRNNPHAYINYLLSEGGMLWTYLINFILPLQWDFLYDFPLSDPGLIWDWFPLISLFGFIWIIFGKISDSSIRLLFVAIFVCFAPEFFYPRALLGQDQRCYLPILLFAALVYKSGLRLPKSQGPLLNGALALIVIVCQGILFLRVDTYNSIPKLHARSNSINPYNLYSVSNVVTDLMREGKERVALKKLRYAFETRLPEVPKSFATKKMLQNKVTRLFELEYKLNGPQNGLGVVRLCNDFQFNKDFCLLIEARWNVNEKKFPDALAFYDKIENKESVIVMVDRLTLYLKLDQKGQALKVAQKLEEIAIGDIFVVEKLIQFYNQLEQGQKVLSLAEKVLKNLKDTQTEVHYQRRLEKIIEQLK